MKLHLKALLLSILVAAAASNCAYAFVLNNATTLGQNKWGISAIYSVNTIKTYVPDSLLGPITADLSIYATGAVFQYGLLDNVDLMLGLGTINYSITPNLSKIWQIEGGNLLGGYLLGTSIKISLIKEGAGSPISIAYLLQYVTLPLNFKQEEEKLDGYDYDVYHKMIVSKNFGSFLPYIAFGVDSRLLKLGGETSSQSTIAQVDVGYGTAVAKNLFIGVEFNWSGVWHDPVMDDLMSILSDEKTYCDAVGYSFGVEYVF